MLKPCILFNKYYNINIKIAPSIWRVHRDKFL